MADMSADDAMKLVQTLLEHPSVKKMADLDIWARDRGIDSEARARIVKEVSGFLVSVPSVELGKEYVQKLAEVIANLGPDLIRTMRTQVSDEKKGS